MQIVIGNSRMTLFVWWMRMCRFWTENVSPFLCNSECILHSDLASGLGTAAEDLLTSSVDDRLEERFLLVLICTSTENSKDGYS